MLGYAQLRSASLLQTKDQTSKRGLRNENVALLAKIVIQLRILVSKMEHFAKIYEPRDRTTGGKDHRYHLKS